MKYLSHDAANLFLWTSKEFYLFRLISWSQLMERFAVLAELTHPSNPCHQQAVRALQLEEWSRDVEWGESVERHQETQNGPDESILSPISGGEADEEELFLCFFAGKNTGLSGWEFHQYDDDFFPSIPHGHWLGRHQPKLDPYLGWVYRGSRQVRRESRKNIVALWNDDKFREFARRAIDYYLAHHPYYNGWRVLNPRHLPRMR